MTDPNQQFLKGGETKIAGVMQKEHRRNFVYVA